MKCKVISIRLEETYRETDEAAANDFLQAVNVKRMSASLVRQPSLSRSVIILYEGLAPEHRKESASVPEARLTDEERQLYDKLVKWRSKKALEEQVPPYMIAHNTWLREMVRLRATTRDDLVKVKNFGESRAQRYGEEILAILRSHYRENSGNAF